jgi:hypothetical protein
MTASPSRLSSDVISRTELNVDVNSRCRHLLQNEINIHVQNIMFLTQLHNEELQNLYPSPSIIIMIKSRRRTASVIQWSESLAIDPEIPGSVPGAIRFSEK